MENQNASVQPQEPPTILKSFPKKDKKSQLYMIVGALLVVLAGVIAGWFLSGGMKGKNTSTSTTAPATKASETEAGVEDTSKYPDEVEGKLVEGGIDGEGSYHLERPGGETKYVYLTSTVIDLQSFVGKQVKVWGQTVSGKKAGWLMDVGRVQVVE